MAKETVARVTTRTVGRCFATVATVRRGRKTLHTTDPYGQGSTSAATLAALRWCAANGVPVRSEDYEQVSWIASVDGLVVS